MEIVPFETRFQDAVLDLIVGIQRGEFGIDITAERQPDLQAIPAYYQAGAGNFWVATIDRRVVGTISLLDIGCSQGALRKMFVSRDYRGSQLGTAKRLLGALLDWAREHDTRELFLGTTSAFLAAHRFYEKNGFTLLAKDALPAAFPLMEVDSRFYRRVLA